MAQSSDSSGLSPDDTVPASAAIHSLAALKVVTIPLDFPKEPSAARFASLFHHFEVIDERPDTARISALIVIRTLWLSNANNVLEEVEKIRKNKSKKQRFGSKRKYPRRPPNPSRSSHNWPPAP